MHMHPLPEAAKDFSITQNEMDWLHVGRWESIFSLSNGVIGTRGMFDEAMPGVPGHRMSFMAGLYNTLPEGVPEWPVLPDWTLLRIQLGDDVFDMRRGHLRSFDRCLDLKLGLLTRDIVWQAPSGQTSRLTFARFLSLAQRDLAVQFLRIVPLDWNGIVKVETPLCAPPVSEPGKLSHWMTSYMQARTRGHAMLGTRTSQSNVPLALASSVTARLDEQFLEPEPVATPTEVSHLTQVEAAMDQCVLIERIVSFKTATPADPPPIEAALERVDQAASRGVDALLTDHTEACAEMWDHIDIQIEGPLEDQRALRFNLFQLATACPHSELTASIGAKGLTGTHYSGHIFWDTEIYMMPFFTCTRPALTRHLLMYRYETLPGARRKALEHGFDGALYAWESADTGDEACPRFVPDPHTGQPIRVWTGDLQHHITADVTYAIDQYVRISGDEEFLWSFGAEIVFETARFWASRVTLNEDGRYDILAGMGPDEFHTHTHNDALTNYLARFNLRVAADLYEHADFPDLQRQRLLQQLGLQPEEVNRWRQIAENITILHDEKTGIIHESEGFLDRPDVSPEVLQAERRCPITDVIGAGIVIESQVLKQAEVVVLLTLFEDEFDATTKEVNFDYYEPRTSHDSSLSFSSHAWAAARLKRVDHAYDYWKRSAYLDLEDRMGKTASGLHAANMGGLWLATVFGFAGVNADGEMLQAVPDLPRAWSGLRFKVEHRGQRYEVVCTPNSAQIKPI